MSDQPLVIDAILDGVARIKAAQGPVAALARIDEARRIYGNEPRLLFAMASAFREAGMNEAALQLYAQLEASQGANPAFLNNYANALDAAGQREKALAVISRAVASDATNIDLLVTQAGIERHSGNNEAARTTLEKALALDPEHGVAKVNLAEVLTDLGDVQGSLHWQRKALDQMNDNPMLRHNLSQTLFKLGQFEEAWQLYEARFENMPDGNPRVRPRAVKWPRWDGKPLPSGKLLVWMEQGVGEEILYASLLNDAARAAGVPVVVECEPRLAPLFKRSFPHVQVVPRGQNTVDEDIGIAAHIAAASLGGLFRNMLGAFPKHKGYLQEDAVQVAGLKEKYGHEGKKIIGLSWRSKPRRYADNKSIPLSLFVPLMKRMNAQFVSLQYGDVGQEIEEARAQGANIMHDGNVDPLQSLEAFAAQVAACDEVITVSNTTAHMAGALNIPARVLLPLGVDAPHHWFYGQGTSPWYPSLRLLWQSKPGIWKDVVRGLEV